LTVGLSNYAAAYATGLLIARRHLKTLGLDTQYEGQTEVDGEDFSYDPEELENEKGKKPFKCFLDVGIARTTTGARIFAVLKGATDGGLNIPHGISRFAGFKADELDSAKLRHYLFGGHVADYMKKLQASNPEKYKKQFSKYIAAEVTAKDLEALYSKVHKAIREAPERKKSDKPAFDKTKQKRFRPAKRSLAQRKARIAQKKAAAAKRG
jgi:large subunit ribosomal protein L5e